MSIGESYLSKHHRSFIHCKLPWRRICITVAPNGVSIHVTHVNFAKFECCTKYFSIIKSRYEKRQNRSQICHEIKSPYFGEPGHTLTFQFCTLFREENTDWKLICWDNHPPTQLLSSVILRILFRTYAREMSVIWLFHQKTLISAAYAREVATPTLAGGDASVHIPYYLRRRTGSKILVY